MRIHLICADSTLDGLAGLLGGGYFGDALDGSN